MSSTGQIVGTVVGAVIGLFVPVVGVALGASIGGAIGGAIDPPKGPKIEGPRLSDTTQQTATYGAPIPRTRARIAVSGNVFWIENNALKEVSEESSQGKGGGGSSLVTYTYYGTFALGLADCTDGTTKSLGRIWIGGKLFYDPTAASLESAIASGGAQQFFTFYNGDAAQLPDERMQAALGIANVPAYRGLCYLVFKDLPLAEYMNSIVGTRIKVELMDAAGSSINEDIGAFPLTGNYIDSSTTVRLVNGRLVGTTIGMSSPSNYPVEIVTNETIIGTGNVTLTSRAQIDFPEDVFFGSHGTINVIQSDENICLTERYLNTNSQIIGFSQSGNEVINTGSISSSVLPYPILFAAIDRGEIFACLGIASSRIYKIAGGIHDFAGPEAPAEVVQSDILSYTGQIGISENFVFALMASGSTTSCTVIKLDRTDMTTVSTFTQSVSSYDAKISVVDDRTFYTIGESVGNVAPICKWVDGVVVATDYPLVFSSAWNNSTNERFISQNDQVHYAVRAGDTAKDIVAIYGVLTGETTTLGAIVEAECLLSNLIGFGDIDTTALTQEVRGYKTTNPGSIRSAIEPLRGGWPFDVIQSGYTIKFYPRGSVSVATVPESDLDARSGGQSGIRFSKSREMATQIPRRVEVSYIDAGREYEIGPAGIAERLNTDSVNVATIELPIVLTANEAAGKAETLLYLYWLERNDIAITLPPTYANLEPGDVITVSHGSATDMLRITDIQYLPDGRSELACKPASTTIYTPTAYGQDGLSTGLPLVLSGNTWIIPLDIPCVTDAMDATGCPVAIYGERAGWPGGVIVRSYDNGQTWETLSGTLPPSPVIGITSSAVATGRTDIIDTSNTITIQPSDISLSSVTEAQMFAGSNMFAVGDDGRWEIIGAKTCTLQGDNSWVLSDLLRGRYGSEWAIGLHQAGDRIVLLDQARIPFVDTVLDKIGIPAIYRGITNGSAIDSGADVGFTYAGVNYECLAPIYINGGIDPVTEDWTVTWLRRTRVGGEWRDYIDAPLSETAESYEAEIWDSTFSNLKRTITGLTSPTFTWTAAQQVTDFSVKQQVIRVKIFQLSDKVGRGYPAQTSLTRALYVAPDPYWTSVSCLLHGDGSDGTNNFVDQKGKTVSVIGGYPTHETSSFKWGGSSIYFYNGGISIARNADFGFNADASIEFWINPDSNTVGSQVVFSSAANLSQKSIGLRIYRVTDTTWTPNLLLYPSTLAGTSGCITSGTWQFFQIIRSGNNVYFYRNGTGVGTFTYNAGDTYDTYCSIGAATDGSVVFKGYIDDFRITKGVARAAGTPTVAFPDA